MAEKEIHKSRMLKPSGMLFGYSSLHWCVSQKNRNFENVFERDGVRKCPEKMNFFRENHLMNE